MAWSQEDIDQDTNDRRAAFNEVIQSLKAEINTTPDYEECPDCGQITKSSWKHCPDCGCIL